MSPLIRPITAADTEVWSRRVPAWLVRIAAPIALVAAVAVGIGTEADLTITVEDLRVPLYFADAAGRGAVLAALLLLPAAPLFGTWVASLGALGIVAANQHGPRAMWLGIALGMAVLGTAQIVTRLRQAGVAASWAPTGLLEPELSVGARHFLLQRAIVPVAGAVVGLVLALVGGWLLAHDTLAANAFRAHAELANGVVASVADDDSAAFVTISGRRYRIPSLSDVTHDVGDRVQVRYDSRSGRAEFTDDVFDPNGAWMLITGGLAGGAGLLAEQRRRRRAARRLFVPGPAVRLLATWGPRTTGVVLGPVDDGTRPFARADHVLPTGSSAFDAWLGHELGDVPGERAEAVRRSLEELENRPAAELTDEELLTLARGMAGFEDATPDPRPPCTEWDVTPVDVVGLSHDNAPIALRGPDGRWYASDKGVAAPHRGDRSRREDRTSAPVAPAGEPSNAWARFWARVDARMLAFGRATGDGWVPWAVAPAVGLGLWWLAGTPDLRWYQALVFVIGACFTGRQWVHVARPPARILPEALALDGAVLTHRIPWSHIIGVAADESSVVIRLDPEREVKGDAVTFTTGPDGGQPVAGAGTPGQARELIETARRAAAVVAGPSRGMAGELPDRPTRASWSAAWWGACVALGFALGAL